LEWTGAIVVPVIAGGVGTKLLVDRQIDSKTAIASEFDEIVSTCSINNCGGISETNKCDVYINRDPEWLRPY
jgi:anaerobic dimethyl sulfoxide reductase subunit A